MGISILNLTGDLAIRKGETYDKIEFYYTDDISSPNWEMAMHIRKNYSNNNTSNSNIDKLAEFLFLPNIYGTFMVNGISTLATKISPYLTYSDTRNILLPDSSIKNKTIVGTNVWVYELEAFNTVTDVKLKLCTGYVEVIGEITIT